MENIVYQDYSLCRGIEPNEEDFKKTLATVKYLKDNNKTNKEIITILRECNKDKITGEDLPEYLWEDSLLQKGVFYYSDILHIKSKPPTFNPVTFEVVSEPFFMEIEIKFTIEDLLDYYYDKCRVPVEIRDRKKDKGAFLHLIKKYNAFKNVPGIDYVISLIEYASKDINKELITNVFEIEEYNKDVIEKFNAIYQQAEFEKANQIIWRN